MTDTITKDITVRATPARVWRALTDTREFSAWFGADLRGEFAPGVTIRGTITTKTYADFTIELAIAEMERERLLAFRWHPFAVDRDRDYSAEPTTLVEIRLEPVADGTRITVTESGFEQLPPDRRAPAFAANGRGWAAQLDNIARHVA